MKKALLLVEEITHFVELLRVAKTMQQSGTYTPVFYFGIIYPGLEAHLQTCHAEGIVYFAPGMAQAAASKAAAQAATPDTPLPTTSRRIQRTLKLKRLLKRFPRFLKNLLLRLAYDNFILVYLEYRRRLQAIRHFLDREQPDILLMAEDNASRATALWIKAGHERAIPSVIVPFTVANALEFAEAFMHVPLYSLERWTNRIVGRWYPRWVYEHKGHKMLRLPGAAALSMEWLGAAPPLPWILNSGYADAIAVESQFMHDYYRREGLPEEQLIVTGALYDDVLAENLREAGARRAALYEKLGLPLERPMLLCALPPRLERRPGCDFPRYDDLAAFWIKTLAAVEGWNVVVNLHPALDYDAMRYIEPWGVRIARQNIATLIPLCDLYNASVSATIRMAIACGKPVINYDVYRFHYTDYVEAAGVITLQEQDDFVKAVQRLTGDPDHYAEVRACQQDIMARWGQLDGQAAARMMGLFDRLIEAAGRGES